ncbi:MAG: hypothetical protein A3G20_03110 [Acidobacteria bacterium RIFCSPLOWO2_12_FULL_59_11]|nr:MAG: hypothetical protein A3G20_03110 [Acidobacteria bacterium RIFCSPLOWO2_12_FULL_59_11]
MARTAVPTRRAGSYFPVSGRRISQALEKSLLLDRNNVRDCPGTISGNPDPLLNQGKRED